MLSAMVLESLCSRRSRAAESQPWRYAVPSQRTLLSARLRMMLLWDDRQRWIPQPLLAETSLSAT